MVCVEMLHLSQDPESDRLLSENPLALLIGMVLDQQVPLEWAFAGPAELKRRMDGPLDARTIAAMPGEELTELFTRKPALHRYPGSMAKRVHQLCELIMARYGGKAENIWRGVRDADELLLRLNELPGFGEHKSKIFVALLGKQIDVRPEGWQRVSSPFGDPGSQRSVADIVDEESLMNVRAAKLAAKQNVKKQAAKKQAAKKQPAKKQPAKKQQPPKGRTAKKQRQAETTGTIGTRGKAKASSRS